MSFVLSAGDKEAGLSLKITLRHAVLEDNTRLAEFGRQAFDDNFGPHNRPEDMAVYLSSAFSPEKQAAEIADPDSIFLIAEIEDRMAGYARLLGGPAPEFIQARKPVELVRIYADQAWIGKGIGAALMQASLDEAARKGCDVIWLGVWERNERALAFYRRWGFKQAGTQAFQLGADLQTDIVMFRATMQI